MKKSSTKFQRRPRPIPSADSGEFERVDYGDLCGAEMLDGKLVDLKGIKFGATDHDAADRQAADGHGTDRDCADCNCADGGCDQRHAGSAQALRASRFFHLNSSM